MDEILKKIARIEQILDTDYRRKGSVNQALEKLYKAIQGDNED